MEAQLKKFYNYLKDSFDVLYKEGETNPKMMSVGLHCRIVGKPGRLKSLERFMIVCTQTYNQKLYLMLF